MSEIDEALRLVFAYLAETDSIAGEPTFDAVVGFGMFDLTLPVYCGDLYAQGAAKRIVFTGGVGAGTGNLGGPEAVAWRDALHRSHPAIPAGDVLVESQSTNTAENIRFTADLLRRGHPPLAFGLGTQRVIVVASPTRLRRVWLTLRHLEPAVTIRRRLPPVDVETDEARYRAQGIDYASHMAGELDRVVAYPERDWIVREPLPASIEAARRVLGDARRP